MQVDRRHIEGLKDIYQKRFRRDLSDKDAYDIAIRLINLYKILLSKPLRQADKIRTSSTLPSQAPVR